MKKNIIIISLTLCFMFSGQYYLFAETAAKPRLGIWITAFSPEKVMYSKENADTLIRTCTKCGINDIYLQLYRADKAYYDSGLTDRTSYDAAFSEARSDTVTYLIKTAEKNDIRVHAWVNLLCIAQNREANILKKFGDGVLTTDQYGRTSMQKDQKDTLDNYYIRENQLFLDPGDGRVRAYLAGIVQEIVSRYPELSGVHLDYVRYPAVVPFVPGARFTSHGISYGYNAANLKNFRSATGLDAAKMPQSRGNFLLWDKWRRDQVTSLVKEVSQTARAVSPAIKISCAIVPSVERTYLTTFQDWTAWLKEGYVNYVVAMNYTDDTKLMELNTRSLMTEGFKEKIQIGVGAYLLKDSPKTLEDQISLLRGIPVSGIVIFSYDDIAANKNLQDFLIDNSGN
ncbi:MAG: family 10 glycosylhydrolase [Candidatus Omnitrophota bacterium]